MKANRTIWQVWQLINSVAVHIFQGQWREGNFRRGLGRKQSSGHDKTRFSIRLGIHNIRIFIRIIANVERHLTFTNVRVWQNFDTRSFGVRFTYSLRFWPYWEFTIFSSFSLLSCKKYNYRNILLWYDSKKTFQFYFRLWVNKSNIWISKEC